MAEEAVGQLLRARLRTVGESHLARMMRGEMRRREFNHFTGADEQHALLGNARINAFRQPHRSGSHRHRARADVGFAAYGFGDRESALEQLVEHPAQRAGLFGRAHRTLELAENLRLAQHHRIQTAGHAKCMFHRTRLRQLVQIRLDLRRLHAVVIRHPVDGRARFRGRAVDLGAVARGNDRRFADRPAVHQVTQGLRHLFGMENHPLTHIERRGLVVQSEGE